jgi:hypothetical protein
MTRLSFEVGNTDNRVDLNLLEYRFPIGDRLNVYLYGNAASHPTFRPFNCHSR